MTGGAPLRYRRGADNLRPPATIDPTAICLLLLCVAIAGVSASETALLALREHQIPALAKRSAAAESRLRALFERRERLLTQVLVVGSPAQLGAAVCALLLAPRWAAQLDQPAALVLVGLFAVVVGLFDCLPKMLALARPGPVLRLCAPPLLWAEPLLRPLIGALGGLAERLAGRLTPKRLRPQARIEDEELGTMIEMGRDKGDLPDWEAEVIHEIVKLGDKTAKDVMTPRVDVVAIDKTAPAEAVDRLVRSCHHRFLPVYDNSPDAVVGVLDSAAYLHSGGRMAGAIAKPVFVPETMAAEQLFRSHLNDPRRLVVVLDEHGGFEGVATASDIIEDLIRDAVPPADGAGEIRHLGAGTFLATGAARLEGLEVELGVALAEDGIDTIGGLLFTRAGDLPSPGDAFGLDGHRATVRRCSGKRIEEVLIEPAPGAAGGGGAAP